MSLHDWPLSIGSPTRGQVLLVHGLGEHIGHYTELADRLNQWGFAVRGYDQYGHGESSGGRGELPQEDRLVTDLAAVIDDTRARLDDRLPLILLGHCLGALVAARLVSQKLRRVEGLVLSSPPLDAGLGFARRVRIVRSIGMHVMMAMMRSPPQGAALYRCRAQQGKGELHRARGAESAMREIAVIEAGQREHPRRIQPERDPDCGRGHAHPEHAETSQVHGDEWQRAQPIDTIIKRGIGFTPPRGTVDPAPQRDKSVTQHRAIRLSGTACHRILPFPASSYGCERGVLIVGSGNIVHNLRATRRGTAANEAYDWATEFDTVVQDQIKKGQLAALPNFMGLGAVAKQAHPTHEHYLPLLYAAGAVQPSEMPRFFNTGYQSASISMRSVLWG